MNLFGLRNNIEIEIRLKDEDKRRKIDIKTSSAKKEKYPLYFDGDSLNGKVIISLKP